MPSGIRYLTVRDGEGMELEVTELPIQWEAEGDGWIMFIPHVVNGHQAGGVMIDITVTTGGVLTAEGIGVIQFASADEAKRFAETTFRMQEGGN